MPNFEEYWNTRYLEGEKIWGDRPSKSAEIALKYFETRKINKILVPGAGYGRNTKIFSTNHYSVTGIEISSFALRIAREFDDKTLFIKKNILDMEYSNVLYDAIYCFNTLHLFLEKERQKFLKNCYNLINRKGYLFFVVFSDLENSYGKGKKIEENTFESKPGRPTHYFTEIDLIDHFKKFKIINLGRVEDNENHGSLGKHTHFLRYIFAQKK
jgi:SAM-dependent methyltransferase